MFLLVIGQGLHAGEMHTAALEIRDVLLSPAVTRDDAFQLGKLHPGSVRSISRVIPCTENGSLRLGAPKTLPYGRFTRP